MKDYIALDIETTGMGPDFSEITEIGGVRIKDNQVVEHFSQLVNPRTEIPEKITEITGITNEMVKDQPLIQSVLTRFVEFCGDQPILGHNVLFDFSFLKLNGLRCNLDFEKEGLDTLALSRQFTKNVASHSLSHLLIHYNIPREKAHRAYDDALATHKLYQIIKEKYLGDATYQYFVPEKLIWVPKKQEPITLRQKSYLSSLMKKHHIEGVESIGQLTKRAASRKIDGLIRDYGRY